MRTPAPPYATASGWIGPSEGLGNPPPPPLTCPPPPLTCPPPPLTCPPPPLTCPPPPLTCPPPPLTCPPPPLTCPPSPPMPFMTRFLPIVGTHPRCRKLQAVRTIVSTSLRFRPDTSSG